MLVHRKVKFILHKRSAGQVEGLPIRMRVTLRGERPIDFPLGCKVDMDKWDADAQRVLGGVSPRAMKSTILTRGSQRWCLLPSLSRPVSARVFNLPEFMEMNSQSNCNNPCKFPAIKSSV